LQHSDTYTKCPTQLLGHPSASAKHGASFGQTQASIGTYWNFGYLEQQKKSFNTSTGNSNTWQWKTHPCLLDDFHLENPSVLPGFFFTVNLAMDSETRNHSNQRQLILHQKEIPFFSGKLTLYGKHHQFFEVRSFNMNSTYHSRYKWAIHSFCAIFNRFSSSKHSPAGSFSAAEPWGACEVQ